MVRYDPDNAISEECMDGSIREFCGLEFNSAIRSSFSPPDRVLTKRKMNLAPKYYPIILQEAESDHQPFQVVHTDSGNCSTLRSVQFHSIPTDRVLHIGDSVNGWCDERIPEGTVQLIADEYLISELGLESEVMRCIV